MSPAVTVSRGMFGWRWTCELCTETTMGPPVNLDGTVAHDGDQVEAMRGGRHHFNWAHFGSPTIQVIGEGIAA